MSWRSRTTAKKPFFADMSCLTQVPYLLHADEMTRTKATGIVTHAYGHIDGTWISDKGEKVKAYGDEGYYEPAIPKTELWGTRPDLYPLGNVEGHRAGAYHSGPFYRVSSRAGILRLGSCHHHEVDQSADPVGQGEI